jgi:Protein of unknown function (DUF4058)
MPIHARQNLYPGINAHLNSLLQQKGGGWQSFHGAHIEHLQEAIEALLPPNYYADSEQSLQVSGIDYDLWIERSTQPDLSIFQVEESTSYPRTSSTVATAPTLDMPLWETIADEEDFIKGLAIYHMTGDEPSEAMVTRIELISPSNKPPHAYYKQYLTNRLDTLKSGVALVEIDYIHQRRPLLPRLPNYAQGAAHAFPYMVLSSNPRTPEGSGSFQCYGIDVLAPLTKVTIPLLGDEFIVLDLGQVYNRTFASRRRYALRVDYAVDPPDVDRFSVDDQAAMRAFLEEVRRGRSDVAGS